MAATQCELIVWCCLLYDAVQKDEPPEITYCVVNQNGMLHLQSLAPTQPMPEPSELDAKFTELLVSSDTLLRLLVLRFPPPPPAPPVLQYSRPTIGISELANTERARLFFLLTSR